MAYNRAAKLRYQQKHRLSIARRKAVLYARHRRREIRKVQQHYTKHRGRILEQQAHWRRAVKRETLTHYGKNQTLRCCWRNCECSDLDMLTLDHVKNDGADHRREGFSGGAVACSWLKRHGYPKGYQTLCANHQLKKETTRKRREARRTHLWQRKSH